MAQVTVEAKYVADTAQYVKALRTAAQATMALADQIPGQVQAQDNLRKSTEALGQGAEEASKGFTILRNAMGTALGVAAVNLVTNVTGRLKGFAKASFDAAARVEELDIAMNSIGEATGLGADTIKEATTAIRNNGIELAAAQQIAIEFAQNQLDLASASKVARVAQDLAVIAGQNSTATTQLLTQAIITGNSMLLKSAGISRLASEGYAEYAKQIGKSVRQLSAQERQQAVTNLILQEGERVAGTYEGAMNAAGKVLRSFKRIINDIQIEIGKILLNAFGPLIKSTYDLLKAFSKSVRDGGALSNTLSMLSTSFQTLTEPLVQFIKNLTESVKSGEAMANVGNAVETIIPPLMTAVETVRALAATYASVLIPALQALLPLFTALASVITPLLQLFTSLPEPIRMVIGLFVLMQIAMAKSATAAKIFGLSWASLRTGFTTGTKTMMVSLKAFEIRIKTAMIKAKTQMGALAAAAKVMSAGVAASFRAMAVAVKGFLLSLGPIGLALIAVTVAFEVLAGKSADTQAKVEALRDTIDETTGAFTELSKQTIMADLRKQFSAEDQQRLRDMGLSVEEMADAIVKGGPAIDAMAQKFNDAITPVDQLNSAIALGQGTLEQTAQRAFGGYAKIAGEALDQTAQAALDNAAAQQRAARETQISLTQEMAKHKQREQETISSLINMTEAEKQHRDFMIDKTRSMNDVTESAIASIEALDAATQALTEAISAEATYDKARKSIKDLGKSFKDNGKKVKGFSDEALNNRKAIRDAASSYIEYANSLQDPIERQAALEEGQERITAALERADIDPSKSKILQTLKEEAEQSGETVAEFAAQRDKAAQYGNEVGKNFIDGIIEELAKGKSVAADGSADVVEGMLDAAANAQQSSSPSKKTMKLARDFIDGLIVGIKQNKKLAEMEISDLGQDMVDALEDKLNEFQRKMQTAISAFSNISELVGGTRAEFGLPSQIMESFGEDASISGVLSSYEDLSSSVQEMFAPFLDKEMVPKKVRRENRKAMNSALGELKQLTKNTVKLLQDRERIQQDMRDLDQAYSQQTASINKHYDKLEKAAADNTKRIEQHYAQLIPRLDNAYKAANAAFERENRVLEGLISDRNKFLEGISTGFRSFLNNLKVDVSKSSKTVTRMTKKMVNGLEVLTQETFTEESTTGGSFADALQGRLKALREFTANIRTLLSRGLDPALVQDLVAAGVENAGDTVSALAAGSSQEIAEINAAQNELGGLIESFQKTSSEQWFDYGIAQQQAIVTPLQIAAEQARVALEQAQIARDMELAAARAHQEQLRIDRQAELDQAREDYTTQKDELIKQSADINDELNLNAQNIEDVFLALRDSMKMKMIPTGRRIINGIIRGLRDREGALYAKARAIADNVKRTIEAAFQIASPSKVTRTMGQQIADGLALGMEDGFRSVSKAAAALADSAMVPLTTPDFSGLGAAPSVGAMSGGAVRSGPITSNYNVTVNAGMGADKTEIARVVVDSLKQYERRNGPIPITVRS